MDHTLNFIKLFPIRIQLASQVTNRSPPEWRHKVRISDYVKNTTIVSLDPHNFFVGGNLKKWLDQAQSVNPFGRNILIPYATVMYRMFTSHSRWGSKRIFGIVVIGSHSSQICVIFLPVRGGAFSQLIAMKIGALRELTYFINVAMFGVDQSQG